jgi:hypothetical protein
MSGARKPDIEFRREIRSGTYRTYGHVYWRPLIVHVLGRTLIGKRHLREEQA